MWVMIAGLAVVLAQSTQPGPGSKSDEWCFDRGQEAQLCEATQEACDKLRQANTDDNGSGVRHRVPAQQRHGPLRILAARVSGRRSMAVTLAGM